MNINKAKLYLVKNDKSIKLSCENIDVILYPRARIPKIRIRGLEPQQEGRVYLVHSFLLAPLHELDPETCELKETIIPIEDIKIRALDPIARKGRPFEVELENKTDKWIYFKLRVWYIDFDEKYAGEVEKLLEVKK